MFQSLGSSYTRTSHGRRKYWSDDTDKFAQVRNFDHHLIPSPTATSTSRQASCVWPTFTIYSIASRPRDQHITITSSSDSRITVTTEKSMSAPTDKQDSFWRLPKPLADVGTSILCILVPVSIAAFALVRIPQPPHAEAVRFRTSMLKHLAEINTTQQQSIRNSRDILAELKPSKQFEGHQQKSLEQLWRQRWHESYQICELWGRIQG